MKILVIGGGAISDGTPIAQLAKEFNRTYGSIKARLKKLRLIE